MRRRRQRSILAKAEWTYSGLSGCTMVTLDNSTLLYPRAQAVLDVPDTFSAAPTDNSVIELWMTPQDVDGANDVIPPPDSAGIKQAEQVGVFRLTAFDVQQRTRCLFSMEGVKAATFAILNRSGVSTSYSTNPLTVKVTLLSQAPT